MLKIAVDAFPLVFQVTPAQAATATAPETCGGSNYFASQPNDTDQAGLLAVEPVGQVNNGLVAAADTAANATPAEVPQQDSANLVQVEYGRILVFPRAGVLVADGADAARGVRIAGENIDTVDASGNDWRAKQLGDFIRNLPDNIKVSLIDGRERRGDNDCFGCAGEEHIRSFATVTRDCTYLRTAR